MIEHDIEKKEVTSPRRSQRLQKSTLFLILAILNTVAILLFGSFIYKWEKGDGMNSFYGVSRGIVDDNSLITRPTEMGQLIPLETFLVNLAGNHGRKLVKLNMELEIDGEGAQQEINRLKPKIRDIIIILLSSKSYGEMMNRKGKEELKNEIRNQVNLFLTKGQIRSIYFTQLIFS